MQHVIQGENYNCGQIYKIILQPKIVKDFLKKSSKFKELMQNYQNKTQNKNKSNSKN